MAGTVQTFLKVLIGASTKGFKKDMSEGEKAVQNFASETKGALDKFAEVFGVDLDSARKQVKGFSDSMVVMGKGLKSVSIGSTGLSTVLKSLRTALLATGIGVIVIALAAMATYFTKAGAGSRALSAELAQLKAVGNVLIDRFAKFGSGLVDLIHGDFVNGFTSIKESIVGIGVAARNAGAQAKALAQITYDLAYAERLHSIAVSESEIALAKLRLRSRDMTLSAQERLAALNEASKVEKQINADGKKIALDRWEAALIASELDNDNKDKKDALAAAYVNYNNLISQSIEYEYSLTNSKNALIKEIKAETLAQEEANKAFLASKEANQISKVKANYNAPRQGNGLVHTQIQTLGAVSEELQEMYNLTEQSIENLATGFGEWVGAFSSGLAGFRDLRQMVGNAFGDMLIQLGQVAIKAGIGIEAVKAAFLSLGGVGAIAAGLSLVAFGASIKGSITQINNARSASVSGGSASSFSSGGGSATYGSLSKSVQSKLQLEGTVTLKLTGADLLAILNNENTRINITT